jgi:catechol 2,3-dioxygenase-like lactoylglutathione lyase family enzyme
MKITSVLIVESVEKSLAFWVDRMGFEKIVEVPADDGLAFVILVRAGAELMLQSTASVRRDEPKFEPPGGSRAALFIEVDDFEDVRKRLDGYPVAMPERVTFYQMREIGVFEPGGHTVIFAVKA